MKSKIKLMFLFIIGICYSTKLNSDIFEQVKRQIYQAPKEIRDKIIQYFSYQLNAIQLNDTNKSLQAQLGNNPGRNNQSILNSIKDNQKHFCEIKKKATQLYNSLGNEDEPSEYQKLIDKMMFNLQEEGFFRVSKEKLLGFINFIQQ